MRGIFHAPFNAALLHAVVLAYPDRAISFHAFPEHARVVRQILEQNDSSILERIEWRQIPLPRAKSLPARWLESRRLIHEAVSSSGNVLFCSISRMQLLHLKKYLLKRKYPQVRAVLHGDLDRITEKSKESFPASLFSLERVLLMDHPPALRYILLSNSIRQNIPEKFRQALAQSSWIDHPYHFPPIQPAAPDSLVFGTFGNTGDGRLLEQVAREVKNVDPSVQFRLIGFLSNQQSVDRLRPLIDDVTDQPISRENFIHRARGVTHALWLAPPDSFRLRASGTLFDALAYGRPLVYTANAYVDPYFSLEPEIGVRCLSLEEVAPAILELVHNHTDVRYLQAQKAIERLRRRFTPEELSKTLRERLAWN
jgi:hypothetical protein